MAGERKITVVIAGDAKGAQDALDKTSKGADGVGKELEGFGKRSNLALAGVALGAGAMAKSFITAAEDSAKVTRQTEAVIKSMGNASNVSADQVGELAGKLAMKTGVDDEVIQSGENVLLTFGKIRNEVGAGNDIFNQATKAALDMSVALGTDMSAASIQVGQALNDPIKGMTALGKAGVSFTEAQKDQVRAMVESGDVMGAQKVILGELTKQFEGSAEAQATAGGKMAVAFGNLQEQIGDELLPVFEMLVGGATDVLEAFNKLPEQTQGVLTKIAAFGTVGIGAAAGVGFVADKASDLAEKLGPVLERMTSAEGGLTKMGKAGALAAGALGLFAAVQIARSFNETTVDIDEMAAALNNLDDASRKQLERTVLLAQEFGKLDGIITKAAEQNTEVAQQFLDQAAAMGVNGDELKHLQGIIDDKREADVAGRLKADEHAKSLEQQGQAAAVAAGDLQALADQLRAQFDPLFAANQAQRALTDAQTKAAEAIRVHGAASREAVEANDAAVQAAFRFHGAALQVKQGIEDETISIQDNITWLTQNQKAMGLTRDQVGQTAGAFVALGAKINTVPDEKSITVRTPGLLAAIANFEKLDKFQGATTVTKAANQAKTAAAGMATGGLVGSVGPFLSGPRGTDTVPAWLTPGEYVLNREAVDRFGIGALEAMNANRPGQLLGQLTSERGPETLVPLCEDRPMPTIGEAA